MASNLSEYTNVRAAHEVLGAVFQQPALIKKYQLVQTDFPDKFHRLLFAAVSNLMNSGVSNIDGVVIDEYLSHYESQHDMFQRYNGVEFVDQAKELAVPDNIKYHVDQIKKFSLLRRYVDAGMDVSRYFDPHEIDPDKLEEQRKRLDEESITDIINHYRRAMLNVVSPFTVSESRVSMKAGDGGHEVKEQLKQSAIWGLGYASAYMTTIFHGMQRGAYTIRSAGSGVGKTRTQLADLAYSCTPYYYDSVREMWMENPNGKDNGVVYIGTEADLKIETNPILWSYIADVPQDHIMEGNYSLGEEERVDRAIDILKNESGIWLECLPEYSVQALSDVIEEHVLNHNIKLVFFDYIFSNPGLISEYQQKSGGKMNLREDQVLLELSTQLKKMARDFDVNIQSATQVNRSFKDETARDQTVIAGATAIVNKIDNGFIASRPTQKELAAIQPIMDELGFEKRPNLLYSVYKVRGNKYNNVKVWLDVDYSTMRTHDMFVTDYEYNLVDIDKTFICVDADQMASTTKAYSAAANLSKEIEDASWG